MNMKTNPNTTTLSSIIKQAITENDPHFSELIKELEANKTTNSVITSENETYFQETSKYTFIVGRSRSGRGYPAKLKSNDVTN